MNHHSANGNQPPSGSAFGFQPSCNDDSSTRAVAGSPAAGRGFSFPTFPNGGFGGAETAATGTAAGMSTNAGALLPSTPLFTSSTPATAAASSNGFGASGLGQQPQPQLVPPVTVSIPSLSFHNSPSNAFGQLTPSPLSSTSNTSAFGQPAPSFNTPEAVIAPCPFPSPSVVGQPTHPTSGFPSQSANLSTTNPSSLQAFGGTTTESYAGPPGLNFGSTPSAQRDPNALPATTWFGQSSFGNHHAAPGSFTAFGSNPAFGTLPETTGEAGGLAGCITHGAPTPTSQTFTTPFAGPSPSPAFGAPSAMGSGSSSAPAAFGADTSSGAPPVGTKNVVGVTEFPAGGVECMDNDGKIKRLQTIVALPEYADLSFEELRCGVVPASHQNVATPTVAGATGQATLAQLPTTTGSPVAGGFSTDQDGLYKPSMPYPLWDSNWDGLGHLHNPSTPQRRTRRILLVRHGDYVSSAPDIDDRVLTARGQLQARLTGEFLARLVEDKRIIALRTSILMRAIQTADIIKEKFPGVAVVSSDPLLNEGFPVAPIPAVPDEHMSRPTLERVEQAFYQYFRRPVTSDEDGYEIIVGHGNVIRFFTLRALQLPPEAWNRIRLAHGSVTCIEIGDSGKCTCTMMGECGHLVAQNLLSFC